MNNVESTERKRRKVAAEVERGKDCFKAYAKK